LAPGKDGNTITFGVTTNYNSVKWSNEFYDSTILTDAQRGVHTIHESLHQIQGFSDQALAVAASTIANPKHPKTFAYSNEGTGEASSYLQGQIELHCGKKNNTPPGTMIIR